MEKRKIPIREDIFLQNPFATETYNQKLTGKMIYEDMIDWDKEGGPVQYPPEGGIHFYLKGLKYPMKGLADMKIVELLGVPKKLVMMFVGTIKESPLRYFFWVWWLLPRFIRRPIFNKLFRYALDTTHCAIGRFYQNPVYLCDFAREIYHKGREFNEREFKGEDLKAWNQFLIIVCMILEYDNAYRYRIQDFLEELNLKDFERKPVRELMRLFNVVNLRERSGGIRGKKWTFGLVAGVAFFFNRKLKKTIVAYLKTLDMEKIKLDENDWYHVCVRPDYDFRGVSFASRYEQRLIADQ